MCTRRVPGPLAGLRIGRDERQHRELRLGNVCLRDEELDVAVLGQIRCRYDLVLQPRHGGQLTSPC